MTNTTPTRRESDNGIELERGRRAPYTQLGDWIALAPVSHAAARLYHLLAAHLNRSRGDSVVWPSRGTLAAMMRYSRPDKVDPLLKQLEDIGAIDVERGRSYPDGSPAPNLYVVHETPPPGYGGEPSLESWYATRKEERQQRLAARAGGSQGSPEKGATPSPEKGATPSPQKGALTRRRELDEVEPASPTPPEAAGSAAGAAGSGRSGRQEPETSTQTQTQTRVPNPRRSRANRHQVQEHPAAAGLVDALEWPGTIDRARITASRRNLITAAASALAAGHHPDAVRATAQEAMPGAETPGSVVAALRTLASKEPDPAVAAAAQVAAAAAERKRLAATRHEFVPVPGNETYCQLCGRSWVNGRVHGDVDFSAVLATAAGGAR